MSRKGINKMGSFVAYTHRNWIIGDPWDPIGPYGRRPVRRTMPPARAIPDPIRVRIARLEGLRKGSLETPEDIQHMHEIRLLRKLKNANRPGKELRVLGIWKARLWKTMEDFYLQPGNARRACWAADVEGKRWLLDNNLWSAFDAVEQFLGKL